MNGDFFDIVTQSKGVSDYTVEEIEEAEKRMKKEGGSLTENLVKVTGRKPSASALRFADDFLGQAQDFSQSLQQTLDVTLRNQREALDAAGAAGGVLQRNKSELDRQIRELNQSLADDFGIGVPAGENPPKQSAERGSSQAQESQEKEQKPQAPRAKRAVLSGEEALAAFAGAVEELERTVFGQKDFLRKLVIAFKRPYVMPPERERAKNALFLIGQEDTGKRYALRALAELLRNRHVLASDEIKVLDLGIYTDASMDKIFLQDLYSALAGEAEILLLERFEACHPSFLSMLASLVTTGSIPLSERYVLQQGQLVVVQNSLVSESVGSVTAHGKYLVFVTNGTLEKAAGVLGAPFIDALGDICETAPLGGDAIRKIAEQELEKVRRKAAEQFSFRLGFADGFLDYSVSRSERQAGLRGVQDFYDSVLLALAQAKLEGDYAKDTALTLRVDGGTLYADTESGTLNLSELLPGGYRGEIDEIRAELGKIVGLSQVKEYIYGLEEYYKVQKRREEEGLKTGSVSKHMIFTGSPGTGKTTIARIISKYLKAIGVLTGGQLVEVSRADLVGRYVGHTAPLTNKVLASAIGGVLFIDEAYSLYRGREDSFGLEAIDTLVKGIEDNRDNLIVILAGYSNEMQEFLTANSGLKSRFPNVINFPDYTGDELLQIARTIAVSKGYRIDEGADDALRAYFDEVQATRAADAGNGRLARNLVEEAILNQSKRLVAEPDADLSVLLSGDFALGEG